MSETEYIKRVNYKKLGMAIAYRRLECRLTQENLAELSGYAIKSGDALVGAQGVLMRASITAFVKLYSRV